MLSWALIFFVVAIIVAQIAQTRASVRKRAVAFNPAHPAKPTIGNVGGTLGAKSRKRGNDVEAASELLFAVEKGLSAGQDMRLSKVRRELVRAFPGWLLLSDYAGVARPRPARAS